MKRFSLEEIKSHVKRTARDYDFKQMLKSREKGRAERDVIHRFQMKVLQEQGKIVQELGKTAIPAEVVFQIMQVAQEVTRTPDENYDFVVEMEKWAKVKRDHNLSDILKED